VWGLPCFAMDGVASAPSIALHVCPNADMPSAAPVPYSHIADIGRAAAAAEQRRPLPPVLFDYSQRLLVILLGSLLDGVQQGLLPEYHSGAVLREVQRTTRRCDLQVTTYCRIDLLQQLLS